MWATPASPPSSPANNAWPASRWIWQPPSTSPHTPPSTSPAAPSPRGTLTLKQQDRQVTDYRVSTPKSAPRTLVIEEAKAPDTVLTQPSGKSVTTTPDFWRVTQDVPAGTTATIRTHHRTHDIGRPRAHGTGLRRRSASLQPTPICPNLCARPFGDATELRSTENTLAAQLAAVRTHKANIVDDQSRIRQNLAAVSANSVLQRRYFATLQSEENELDDIGHQEDALEKQVDAANDALGAYIAGLDL